jgi:hypothetical protein
MTLSTDQENERKLFAAATELCEHDLTPEIRFQISLVTILATAILTSTVTCLILLATWQFSFALLTAIWMWAIGLAVIFYWGEAPRLFGFGAVTGAFESSHHRFIEGPLTLFAKTLQFRPKV